MPFGLLHKKQKLKNVALLAILISLIATLYFVAMIKLSN